MAGFNNQISAIAAAAAASAMLFWWWRFARRAPESGLLAFGTGSKQVPLRWFFIVAGIYVLILTPLALGAYSSPRYYPDSDCILGMLDRAVLYHLKPYVDFEYLYGPILLYPFLLIHKLAPAIPIEAVYYPVTIALMLIGLYFIYWVINELFPDSSPKTLIFLAAGFVGINYLLAAHETFARHFAVFAAIIGLAKMERFAAARSEPFRYSVILAYVALTSAVIYLISPELIFVYAAAVLCYAVASAYLQRSAKPLVFAIGPLAGFAFAVPLLGRNFFAPVAKFAGGQLDFVVVPNLAILAYLVALIVIAPIGVAALLRRKHPQFPVIGAFWAATVCLIVPALARCEWEHMAWDGMGAFLLAFAHLGSRPKRVQYRAVAVWVAIFAVYQAAWFVTFAGPVGHAVYTALTMFVSPQTVATAAGRAERMIPGLRRGVEMIARHEEEPVRELPAAAHGELISMPFLTDKVTAKTLQQAGSFDPEYHVGFCQGGTAEVEQMKIAAMAKRRWVLAWSHFTPEELRIHPIEISFLYPMRFPRRYQPFVQAKDLVEYLRSHYHVVQTIGAYDLWVRN